MTPDQIRQSAADTGEMLEYASHSNDITFRRLRELISGIDYEEHPVPAQKLTKALNATRRVEELITETAELNQVYYQSADELESKQRTQSDADDLNGLIEQIKGALAGADSGSDVVIVVRKASDNASEINDEQCQAILGAIKEQTA